MELLLLPIINRLNSFSIVHPLLGVFVGFTHVYIVWLPQHVLLVVDHAHSHLGTLIMLHNTAHTAFWHDLTLLVTTAPSFRLLWCIKNSRLCFPCREFLLLATVLQTVFPRLLDRFSLHLVKTVFSSLVVQRLTSQIRVCLLRVHFDHRFPFDSLPFRIILKLLGFLDWPDWGVHKYMASIE